MCFPSPSLFLSKLFALHVSAACRYCRWDIANNASLIVFCVIQAWFIVTSCHSCTRTFSSSRAAKALLVFVAVFHATQVYYATLLWFREDLPLTGVYWAAPVVMAFHTRCFVFLLALSMYSVDTDGSCTVHAVCWPVVTKLECDYSASFVQLGFGAFFGLASVSTIVVAILDGSMFGFRGKSPTTNLLVLVFATMACFSCAPMILKIERDQRFFNPSVALHFSCVLLTWRFLFLQVLFVVVGGLYSATLPGVQLYLQQIRDLGNGWLSVCNAALMIETLLQMGIAAHFCTAPGRLVLRHSYSRFAASYLGCYNFGTLLLAASPSHVHSCSAACMERHGHRHCCVYTINLRMRTLAIASI